MANSDLTVEQLATELGTKVSTIRLYQREGLLPAPEVRGRIAYYLPAHVARLRLIGRLQDRGFSLAAIRALLDTWQRGGSLDELVGLEARVAGRSGRDDVVISPAEFAELFPAGEIDPELALRAVELGLVQIEADGNIRLTSQRFVEVGADVARLGVSLAEILEEYGHTRDACRQIADRFVALFARHVWDPFAERGFPADEAREIASEIDHFTELGVEMVDSAMRLAIDDAAAAAFVEEAASIDRQRRS